MSLPTPNLDDRTFQDLVDEAKRYVQRACPTWTNHNVSDPGVTLIETFAWMTDQLLYRLNRVPDRHHVRFLELFGVRLFPPSAAATEVSFRLSAHSETEVVVPAGTVVSTRRTATEPAVGFATTDTLTVVPATSRWVVAGAADGALTDLTPRLGLGEPLPCFSPSPQVDDALYLGLDRPAPANILLIRFVCTVGGHGIDPRHPPLVWEAWTPDGWVGCDVETDGTLGLNASGPVEIHLPAGHTISELGGATAAWVRCRVVEPGRHPAYRSSPLVVSVHAATVGGDVTALHAERISDEVLGTSDGTSGQVFQVLSPPVLPVPGDPLELAVGRPDPDADPDPTAGPGDGGRAGGNTGTASLRWETWNQVDAFTDSGPTSRHFTVDPTTGEIRFGPLVRDADGSVRRHGAVPPKGAVLRLRRYWTGGGAGGNVAARSLTVLRSSIPYVSAVYNRRPALGGVDGETVEEARRRGPVEVRTRNRAVTAADYEYLTRRAAPELARVRCVPIESGPDAPGVRVLLVPDAPRSDGRLALGRLVPAAATVERVRQVLDEARTIGARVAVEPPHYLGIRVEAQVRGRADADPDRVRADALTALSEYFDPLSGGPDADGWPFGRPVQIGEVHTVLARVPGVDFVEEAALFRVNPVTRQIADREDRIDLGPTHLVFGVDHDVYVQAPGGGPGSGRGGAGRR